MPGYTPLNDNFVYEVFMREKEIGSMNEDRYGDSCIKQPSIRLTIKSKIHICFCNTEPSVSNHIRYSENISFFSVFHRINIS